MDKGVRTSHAPLLVHVVDDDGAVRDSINALLRASGYNVRTHHCAASFFGTFDPDETGCVLVDMRMPDATGAEVQDRIVRIESAMPVIIITGHANIRMAVSAMKRGAVEFLEKPVDPQVLLDHVDKALKRREFQLNQRANVEEIQARFGILTPREHDVLRHLLIGKPNKIIAQELGVSPRTVQAHRARVMEKTGAGSLPKLARMAVAAGFGPEATVG